VRISFLLLLAFLSGCAHRAWSPARDGCTSPPPFDTKSTSCTCRGVEHHRTTNVIEFRCGDDAITYVEHHPAPSELP
jgi:hypothetical protein